MAYDYLAGMQSRIFRLVLGCLCLLAAHQSPAQPEDLTQVWPARWIAAADGPWSSYGIHRFRQTFELDTVPAQLIVHTSGDNRYQLFVNGRRVTWGPLRGDLDHWYYESTNIAPYLQPGKNVIAAQVLHYGSHPPDAQLSVQTGFVLAAGDRRFRFLNTNKNWKSTYDPSYSPNIIDGAQVRGYYGGGSREIVDGNQHLWGWAETGFDDAAWPAAAEVESAFAKTCIWASRWKLTPRHLPHERITPQRFKSIRLAENVRYSPEFVWGKQPFTVPANTTARIIFDQGVETTAYPELTVSGGKNARITLRYVEAPVIGEGRSRKKWNRNEIEGKTFFGYYDQFITDGGESRTYRPFWWRAFRYIEMTIETGNEPLEVVDFKSEFSTYPFELRANLQIDGLPEAEADTLQKILEIGERTLRLNAHETFMDCPYYEESQFPGDTRVQALISYALFGDPALGKNAVEQFSWSLNSEGFLSARYPTNSTYYIPNYSLYWIGMLYDYMMYFGEPDYVRSKLPAVRFVLNYFLSRMRPDGTVRKPDYHNFTDWALPRGEGPFDENGYSALVDLHVLLALQWAADLEAYVGGEHFERQYRRKAEKLASVIPELYWQNEQGLFSDTPAGDHYSVHANQLAILAGLLKTDEARQVMRKTLDPDAHDMVGPTIYWQFYQFEALKAAGLAELYLEHLDIWKEMIRAGVTTWPETGLESRSECHGWGASPNYHLYKITAGIEPAAPGFAEVRIEPVLEDRQRLRVDYPHPEGMIRLDLAESREKISGTVELPAGVQGTLIWEERKWTLSGGINEIE